MDINIDNLKKLIEQLKSIGFFKRLFGWDSIKQLLVDAAADLQKLITTSDNLKAEKSRLEMLNSNNSKDLEIARENLVKNESEIERLNSTIRGNDAKISQFTSDLSAEKTTTKNLQETNNQLSTDNKVLKEANMHLTELKKDIASKTETADNLTKRNTELLAELAAMKQKLENTEQNLKEVREQNTHLLKEAEFRKQEHSNAMDTLKQIRDQIKNDRDKEVEERKNTEVERIKKLKETWSNHQERVKSVIKSICEKHTISYVDKVPFKGEPDNTLKICDEFVIFDAKSPGNDDLTNFPLYLKAQSESAKKYAKQDNVKPEIYFVVPSNTLENLTNFVFRLTDYNVFVISLDSLEPIILSLQKIEEYEFAEELSPEERENICRVLGKFAHLSKRRIQIDSFFAKQFFELNYKCESDLPKDILDKAIAFERSEKLNPPIEKRAKQINIKELEKDTIELKKEAGIKGIAIQDDKISTGLNNLPLYKNDNEK